MTHRVNAAALRIGKSLHWHSLGSPLFRWRDLKINLFLNYFLARFLEKETYRLVRYGVRSEAKVFKIAIVAFRATTTLIGRPKGTLKSPFETYWKNHHVYKYHFRLGIVKYILQGIEDRIDHPFDDAVGIIHVDNYKKFFSIGPKWNWKRTEIFFTDGMNVDQNELGEVTPWGVVGFSAPFFVRIAAKLMVLRYAIRKSLLRTIRRRFFPSFPKVFMRVRTRTLNFLDFENRFIAGSSTSSSDWKNMLLAALFFKVGDKRGLKKHFRAFGDNLKGLIKKRVRSKKFTLLSALRKKKFLKIKKKYFLFKKKSSFRWRSWLKRVSRTQKRGSFSRGRYNLKGFFKRLAKANKPFKHVRVYDPIRAGKNKIKTKLLNYEKKDFLSVGSKERLVSGVTRFRNFFQGLVKLIFLSHFSRCWVKDFLVVILLRKKKFSVKLEKSFSSIKSIFGFFSQRRSVKKNGSFFSNVLSFELFLSKLYVPYLKKIVGSSFLKKLGRSFCRVKKFKKKPYILICKTNFFFHFFFRSMAILKLFRLRFKRNGAKYLYRKKKLIFFFEKRLSAFLKRRVNLKFFDPLEFHSMDDLWVKSLFDSLKFISHLYLRNKLDYKPGFMLSLYTMLSFKYNSPAFLGAFIADQLEWRRRKRAHIAFIRLLIYFFKSLRFNTMYTKSLVSFSVGFYGKVWGKLRAGKYIIRSADSPSIPLRRISLKTDSSFTWAESQFGTFGIRIWIARN